MAIKPEVAFLNPPMTFKDLRSLPPPSLDFLTTSPLSMLALTLATWPGAPWVLCGDIASESETTALGEAVISGIAAGVVSAGERVVMVVALDGSLSRGPVSGVPAMSTQSISSASEAALFDERGIVCVSKRRAMRGYTGESRVRGGLKARDPAPQLSLLTLKPEEILRDVSGRRTGLTCRARCRRRRRSRRRGPPPGWSRVAATAPGLAPSWSTVRRIVARWQDTTVKRQSRFLSPEDLGHDA